MEGRYVFIAMRRCGIFCNGILCKFSFMYDRSIGVSQNDGSLGLIQRCGFAVSHGFSCRLLHQVVRHTSGERSTCQSKRGPCRPRDVDRVWCDDRFRTAAAYFPRSRRRECSHTALRLSGLVASPSASSRVQQSCNRLLSRRYERTRCSWNCVDVSDHSFRKRRQRTSDSPQVRYH